MCYYFIWFSVCKVDTHFIELAMDRPESNNRSVKIKYCRTVLVTALPSAQTDSLVQTPVGISTYLEKNYLDAGTSIDSVDTTLDVMQWTQAENDCS